jgi:ABC-2 type transport system ATP-binding protein
MKPLQITHLSKRYGSRYAVEDLSLALEPGTVFGLIGRNGAGKSTAIACTLGLTHASGGQVEWFGQKPAQSLFERIAYVPEINVLDGWMTPLHHAAFRSRCYARFDARTMNALMERFEIEPRRIVRRLSKGQRQAVALALAFAQRPDLMILDEPSSGLDPVLQRRLLDQIVTAAADGVTILFSSHQIGQVEQAAERVGILDRGKLVLEADVDDLRERRAVIEAYFESLPDLSGFRASCNAPLDLDGSLVRVYANGDADTIESALQALEPVTVTRREMTLEQIFFATIGAGKEYRS